MATISTNIITTLQILSDSIAGWLLIVTLTCTLPLINNVLLKQLPINNVNNNQLLIKLQHPNLPPLQSFQLVNCFVLYLLFYPILLLYRNISTIGNIVGSVGFSIGLIVLLGFGVGPAMLKYQKEEVEAKKKQEEEATKKQQEEIMVKRKERDDDDSPWKQTSKLSTPAKATLETSSHSLPEAPTSPSEEEEDDTYGSPLQKHRNLSSSSLKKKQKHRKSHSISTSDNDSLLKEMDGNLIDSNLEPHYSNLIDSANAPIFGVGKLVVCLCFD